MAVLVGAEMTVSIAGAGSRYRKVDVKFGGKDTDVTPANPRNGVMAQKPDPSGNECTITADDLVDGSAADSFFELAYAAKKNGTSVAVTITPIVTGQAIVNDYGPFYVSELGISTGKGDPLVSNITLKGSGGAVA